MTHDYKATLSRLQNDIDYFERGEHSEIESIDYEHGNLETTIADLYRIRQALRIAVVLMQEPSEAMLCAGAESSGLFAPYKTIWKAMRDQLLKEVGIGYKL